MHGYLNKLYSPSVVMGAIWKNRAFTSEHGRIHEVFHVYLNKFENAVTHLIFVILGNN